jgi:hypothetical protein
MERAHKIKNLNQEATNQQSTMKLSFTLLLAALVPAIVVARLGTTETALAASDNDETMVKVCLSSSSAVPLLLCPVDKIRTQVSPLLLQHFVLIRKQTKTLLFSISGQLGSDNDETMVKVCLSSLVDCAASSLLWRAR